MAIGLLCYNKDSTAEEVIDWITYFGEEAIKINENELLENEELVINLTNKKESALLIDDDRKLISIFDIEYIWQRKWNTYDFDIIKDISKKNLPVDKNLNQEIQIIRDFIVYFFQQNDKLLGFCETKSKNKLFQLLVARKVGFKIPDTIVTNSKKRLKFDNEKYITKALNYPIDLNVNGVVQTNYTSIIPRSAYIHNKFFPSLIQENVIKEYEIRTFFLNGICYSMAILSQQDSTTSVDFRKYNPKKPNRNIPYKLPKQIEKKIVCLMKLLNLKIGSIDIIKSKNEYVFLEVNPFGQFGMVSKPCNYYLERLIAKYLIKQKNETKCC